MKCKWCNSYFTHFNCNKPEECDCPVCQGYCECEADSEPIDATTALYVLRQYALDFTEGTTIEPRVREAFEIVKAFIKEKAQ